MIHSSGRIPVGLCFIHIRYIRYYGGLLKMNHRSSLGVAFSAFPRQHATRFEAAAGLSLGAMGMGVMMAMMGCGKAGLKVAQNDLILKDILN